MKVRLANGKVITMKMRKAFKGKKVMPIPIKGGTVLNMPHKIFRPIKD